MSDGLPATTPAGSWDYKSSEAWEQETLLEHTLMAYVMWIKGEALIKKLPSKPTKYKISRLH